MSNIDIIIRESGLLEKFNCTVKDIHDAYYLYAQSWAVESRRSLPMNETFLEMMGQMPGSLEIVNDCSRRNIQRRDDYLLEVEIQKANGTYEDWSRQLSEMMPAETMDSIFTALKPQRPPNSNLPKFS